MGLDRESVVRMALRLLDEDGIEGLTVRRLATRLDVQAPALYWHFKSKQELLDEMATAVLTDALADIALDEEGLGWRGLAVAYGQGMRRMLLAHRDGAKVFSGTYLTDPRVYATMETALRVFTDVGFSVGDATLVLNVVHNYAIGFAIEEQAAHPRPGKQDQRYAPASRAERIDAGEHPRALEAGEEMFSKFDERFERGMELILTGAEPLRQRHDDEPK
jgi:TetR/AcrR family transcriptional regulator, tetracycline repressor protein